MDYVFKITLASHEVKQSTIEYEYVPPEIIKSKNVIFQFESFTYVAIVLSISIF